MNNTPARVSNSYNLYMKVKDDQSDKMGESEPIEAHAYHSGLDRIIKNVTESDKVISVFNSDIDELDTELKELSEIIPICFRLGSSRIETVRSAITYIRTMQVQSQSVMDQDTNLESSSTQYQIYKNSSYGTTLGHNVFASTAKISLAMPSSKQFDENAPDKLTLNAEDKSVIEDILALTQPSDGQVPANVDYSRAHTVARYNFQDSTKLAGQHYLYNESVIIMDTKRQKHNMNTRRSNAEEKKCYDQIKELLKLENLPKAKVLRIADGYIQLCQKTHMKSKCKRKESNLSVSDPRVSNQIYRRSFDPKKVNHALIEKKRREKISDARKRLITTIEHDPRLMQYRDPWTKRRVLDATILLLRQCKEHHKPELRSENIPEFVLYGADNIKQSISPSLSPVRSSLDLRFCSQRPVTPHHSLEDQLFQSIASDSFLTQEQHDVDQELPSCSVSKDFDNFQAPYELCWPREELSPSTTSWAENCQIFIKSDNNSSRTASQKESNTKETQDGVATEISPVPEMSYMNL